MLVILKKTDETTNNGIYGFTHQLSTNLVQLTNKLYRIFKELFVCIFWGHR